MASRSLERRIRGLSGAPGLAAAPPGAAGKPAARERWARRRSFWPHLELLIHGGVSFAPYRSRFEALLDPSPKHQAARGLRSLRGLRRHRRPRAGHGHAGLATDNGLFYNSCRWPSSARAPTRHWVGSIEPGVDYALVLSTCAGLWAYVIGDVVRFCSKDAAAPADRRAHLLHAGSAFGEHVTGELVETCVLAAARAQDLEVAEFAVGTEFLVEQGAWGRHVHVIQVTGLAHAAARVEAFRHALDHELAARNEDYAERRVVSTGLRAPQVEVMPAGGFNAWMKAGGKLGGQHKVPRVVSDASVLAELRRATQR